MHVEFTDGGSDFSLCFFIIHYFSLFCHRFSKENGGSDVKNIPEFNRGSGLSLAGSVEWSPEERNKGTKELFFLWII